MNINSPTTFLQWLLRKTGGNFLLAVVAIAHLSTYLFTIPVSLFIRLLAEFSNEEFARLWGATLIFLPVALGILLLTIYIINRPAIAQLNDRVKGKEGTDNPVREQLAWKQISALPWLYARSGTLITSIFGFAPMLIFEIVVLRLTTDQVIYTVLGVLVSSLSIITLGTIGLEGMITPARRMLLPKSFDAQLAGTSSLKILPKLNVIILTLITIGVLLVAPVGYHFTKLALQSPDQADLLTRFQLQSLGFSLLAILLGAGLAWMISQSVSMPLNNLIKVFQKVERGDLTQIAPVISSDETGELTVFFNRMLARIGELQNSLEQQVQQRTAQLAAVNEVGRAVSAILDQEELIDRVVNLITNSFGHYYTALFLLDPTEKWAELKQATGDAGRVLKESGHRLEVGGKSMVGSAIAQKRARIALDVGAESVRFDNPLLPYTHSEIALPLVVGDRVLGALDVQSTKTEAFGPQDIETFQNMANQVAVALENARLFEETRLHLQEVQAAQRQYLQQGWGSLARQERLEYGVGDESRGDSHLDVPLALRDQIIGQISLGGDTAWTAEDRAWVESVATQAAIALENARLLDQSQKTAAYEKIIADITGKIWSSNTIEGILQTSVRELGRALNATEGIIELKTEENQA